MHRRRAFLRDALDLARERGRLMAAHAEPGMMAAVFAPESAVRAVVVQQPESLAVAALNTPNQVVISGHAAAVERALEILGRDGFTAVIVNHSFGYHSPLMQPAVQPIALAAAALQPTAPAIPFLSTVSVDWMCGATALDAGYWAAQALDPVRFAPALERLIGEGFDTFVEIGPGSTLAAFARQIVAGRDPGCGVEALLRRGEDDRASIRAAAGRLWVQGVNLDLRAIAAASRGRRVALPTYPFARDRHWLPGAPAPRVGALALRAAPDQAPLLHGQPVAGVTLQPTAGGYSLFLKAADGQTLLELADLRADAPARPPLPAPEPPSDPGFLHHIAWVEAQLPEQAADPIGHWIIIADRSGALAERLSAGLHACGQQCILATDQSLEAVLRTVSARRYGIISLADCGPRPAIDHVGDLEQAQRSGVLQLLHVLQRLLALPAAERPAGLWVVTAGAYAIGDSAEEGAPEHALSAGLAAAFPDQHPGFPAWPSIWRPAGIARRWRRPCWQSLRRNQSPGCLPGAPASG
jgi:malonyl CoA-acyl carrier protein transacylase